MSLRQLDQALAEARYEQPSTASAGEPISLRNIANLLSVSPISLRNMFDPDPGAIWGDATSLGSGISSPASARLELGGAEQYQAIAEQLSPEQLQQRIRERAFYRWEARGREHGRDLDDWLTVEREEIEVARKAQ